MMINVIGYTLLWRHWCLSKFVDTACILFYTHSP